MVCRSVKYYLSSMVSVWRVTMPRVSRASRADRILALLRVAFLKCWAIVDGSSLCHSKKCDRDPQDWAARICDAVSVSSGKVGERMRSFSRNACISYSPSTKEQTNKVGCLGLPTKRLPPSPA